MSSIQTGIELNDQFTSVIYGIINSVNMAVVSMYDMQQSMNADINTASLEGAMDEINQVTAAMNELNAAVQDQAIHAAPGMSPVVADIASQEPISVDIEPIVPDPLIENPQPIEIPVQPNAPPMPIEIPVQLETAGLDVFTSTGTDRFRQEVQSANTMLEQLSSTQDAIARQAYSTRIFPPELFQNLNSLAARINLVRDRIQQIENNPINMGTDTANTELEQLRAQLNQAVQEQNVLNGAMQRMDVSEANAAYMHLSQTVSGTERYIRDNVDEQGRFNREIQEGTVQANSLMNSIKGAVAAYVSIQSVGSALNVSDNLTQTMARLNLMNDGAQTTKELFNMIYVSSNNARAPLLATADAIAKMGNNAGAAFSSNAELIAFMEQINKQFAIGGASATEQSNALLQLSQAMASGALRGDELNSILDAAPGIARTIEQSMGWAEGSIKSYAENGEVTAQVVKYALLDMAAETNAAFESMPITFSQAMTDLKSDALYVFQPVLQRLNEISNSESFQNFTDKAVKAMATLANVVLNIFDLVGAVGGFIVDNWSVISPVLYGVITALALYAVYLGIVKMAEIIGTAIKIAMCVASYAHAAATGAEATAIAAATATQYGLNTALLACPLVWIIILIIALIAIIFAVCNAIANMTDAASSGFGIIMGGISVVVQFFKNLLLAVTNSALGMGHAIGALCDNITTAFHNAICSVQSWWYDLLSTVLTVVAGICEALNKLPFVEFDYSGITNAANDFAAKSAEAASNKEEYSSISDAFNEGFNTFDAFKDGWASDAFNAGAEWGDGISEAVSNFSLSDLFGMTELPGGNGTNTLEEAMNANGAAENLNDIAGNTSSMADAMDVSNEELKYLRDIAEQEAVNRYTVAEVTIDQSGMQNTIKNGGDLDGFMSGLTDSVNEAVDSIVEGVHV